MIGRLASNFLNHQGKLNTEAHSNAKQTVPARNSFHEAYTSTRHVNASYESHYSKSSQAAIQIETKDGDIVTLNLTKSYNEHTSQEYLRFDKKHYASNYNERGNGSSIFTEQDALYQESTHQSLVAQTSEMHTLNLSFSVDGDLNEEELLAITELMNSLQGIANNFFNGSLDNILTTPSLIEGSETLSAFTMNLAMHETYEEVMHYQDIEKMQHERTYHEPPFIKNLQALASQQAPSSFFEKFDKPEMLIEKLLKHIVPHHLEETI